MSNFVNTVLVSGGTSGIGLALANGFHDAGFNVIATGLGELPDNKENLRFAHLDVQDGNSVSQFFSQFKNLHTLINAAGIIKRDAELTPEVFAQVIDVNLNGTMRVCSAAREALTAGQGSIINLASMLSYFGGGTVPGYAASKGGVAQLTKSLAIAYADDNIRVNAIAPGWIATPLTRNLREDPTRNNQILARTPMKRWGKPDDLVGPALFLSSTAAGFVTGTILNVDGGYAIS